MDFLIVLASLALFGVWWKWREKPIANFLIRDYLKKPKPKPGSAVVQPYEIQTDKLLDHAIERLKKLDLVTDRDRQILLEVVLPYLQQAKENVEQDLLVPQVTKKDLARLEERLLQDSGIVVIFIVLVYWFLR